MRSSIFWPLMPPAALTLSKCRRAPRLSWMPSCADGPVLGADWPRTRLPDSLEKALAAGRVASMLSIVRRFMVFGCAGGGRMDTRGNPNYRNGREEAMSASVGQKMFISTTRALVHEFLTGG